MLGTSCGPKTKKIFFSLKLSLPSVNVPRNVPQLVLSAPVCANRVLGARGHWEHRSLCAHLEPDSENVLEDISLCVHRRISAVSVRHFAQGLTRPVNKIRSGFTYLRGQRLAIMFLVSAVIGEGEGPA